MDFKQIEAFVNVVRYKSFSKAADATFFTQPTISTHIRNLEKELGVKLLDRKSRIVEMTPQGAKFYKYAVEMINARAQAIDALDSDSDNVKGILELQASSIPSVTFLPELLAGFRREHNGIQYYVSSSDTQTVVDNIIERRGEIGFVGEEIVSNAIEIVKVATDKVVMIAPLSFDIPDKISMSEAVTYPFIISERVAQSAGGQFKIVEIEDYNEDRSFYMINLRSISLSPAAEAFSDYVKSKI